MRDEPDEDLDDFTFYLYVAISIALTLMAGGRRRAARLRATRLGSGAAAASGARPARCPTTHLAACAGAMSGLTLGLMSLDQVDLEILKRSGTAKQKQYAARIMPVGGRVGGRAGGRAGG